MNNISIRTKILVGVVVVNMLGIAVAWVYLHQSYGAGVDSDANRAVAVSRAAFEQLQAEGLDPIDDPAAMAGVIEGMSAISGANYSFMIDKSSTDEQTYTAARQAANLSENWGDGDAYAVLATTDEAVAQTVQFAVPAGDVPTNGRIVGVENGACSEMCHEAITAEGDYWGVAWSTDRKSRVHAVFPVNDAAGAPVGVIYSMHDISAQADEARVSMNRTFIVLAITLVVATLMIGYMIDAWVFRRMNHMMSAIEDVSMRVAGGDFDARFVADTSKDEIGQFEQFFANVLDLMTGTIKSLVEKK